MAPLRRSAAGSRLTSRSRLQRAYHFVRLELMRQAVQFVAGHIDPAQFRALRSPPISRNLAVSDMTPPRWKRTIFALVLFGIAFGYLEAAVVAYLGVIHAPTVKRFYPNRAANNVFPLLTAEQARTATTEQKKTIPIEVGREAATIIMLIAVALAGTAGGEQWAAAFAIAFGTWDIAYYAFLRVIEDWPASLFTWDVLFIIPVPWAAPVLAPIIVSISMIAAGSWHLWREAAGVQVRLWALHWFGVSLGAVIIVASFTLDYRNVIAGGMPAPFRWGVFAAGEIVGILSYLAAVWRSSTAAKRVAATEG